MDSIFLNPYNWSNENTEAYTDTGVKDGKALLKDRKAVAEQLPHFNWIYSFTICL